MNASPVNIVFLIGPSGSGKSVIAQLVAEATGWSVVDTDDWIVARSDFDSISDIFEEKGEPFFRALERQCVEDVATRDGRVIVATGGGLPAIPGMMSRLRQIGTTVYLKAGVDELWERLSDNEGELEKRPLLKNRGKPALEELLESRSEIYHSSSVVLDTDDLFVQEVCGMLVGLITDRGL